MQIKDYFSLLELEASASVTDIKKAYRRLALQLHPDKTGNDPYAAARFSDIKEAYEVLTNPSKKEYYLQQRWYNQSAGLRKTQPVITPVTVLKQSLELERYVSKLDEFRMDREGLLQYMLDLFSDETLEKLRNFNETETKHTIIAAVLRSMKPLNPHQAEQMTAQLQKLAPTDPVVSDQLGLFLRQSLKNNKREKYGFVIALVLTVLICLIIYLTGR